MLDFVAVQKILPHRPPFLLVDRILELEEGRRAVGLKNVTGNEAFFVGHFPGRPVMPGVLIIEAMAQVGATAILSMPEHRDKLPLFAGIDKARFRRPVTPGDSLHLEVVLRKLRATAGMGYGTARVGDEVVAEAELLFVLVKEKEKENSAKA